MLYLFIGSLLAIGAKSQCDNCEAAGQTCVDYTNFLGQASQICGCTDINDCNVDLVKAANEEAYGDISVDCYDAGMATIGVSAGYSTCGPKPCPNGDECDSGVTCTSFGVASFCVSVDVTVACSPECASTQTCIAGQCVTTTCSPECDSTETCIAGQCITTTCDPECETGTICFGGNCVATTCDPECESGTFCFDGSCVSTAGTGDCNDACDATTQVCYSGVCIDLDYDTGNGTPDPTPVPTTAEPTPMPTTADPTPSPEDSTNLVPSAGSQLTIFIGMVIMSIAALFN